MKIRLKLTDFEDNKGSGLGVIVYGMTLLLVLIFTAVNIVNSKIIEDGYLSLTDAVQAASSGSVIHLLTSDRNETTSAQKDLIGDRNAGIGRHDKGTQEFYDIYLQLALGYLINRDQDQGTRKDSEVQTGEINNFIKLDHQKVVNSTLSLLSTAVSRSGKGEGSIETINKTEKYKIMMFFIEPYRTDNKKFFNVIAYGNGNWNLIEDAKYGKRGNITDALAVGIVENEGNDLKKIYQNVEKSISEIVNGTYNNGRNLGDYIINPDREKGDSFFINLNSQGNQNYEQLIRDMETYPHYVIVIKDFALPTIFDGVETNSIKNTIKKAFSLQENRLSSPMCTLNTGKIQRQRQDAGWEHI